MDLEAKALTVQSLLLKTGAMIGELEREVTRGVGWGNTGWIPFKRRQKNCFVMIVQNVSPAPDWKKRSKTQFLWPCTLPDWSESFLPFYTVYGVRLGRPNKHSQMTLWADWRRLYWESYYVLFNWYNAFIYFSDQSKILLCLERQAGVSYEPYSLRRHLSCLQGAWSQDKEGTHVFSLVALHPSEAGKEEDSCYLLNTYHAKHKFSSVQFSHSVVSTLCDPMNRSTPGLPVHHQLPEFTQTHVHGVSDAIQPSHPLSSPSPPAPNPSQHQSLFQWVNSSHEVAKVLEFQL